MFISAVCARMNSRHQLSLLTALSTSASSDDGLGTFEIARTAAPMMPIRAYRDLWDNLNAARGYGWDINPPVWVISFRCLRDWRNQ